MGFVCSCKAGEGKASGPPRTAADFLRRPGWVVLKSITGTGMVETTCRLAAHSHSCHFRCPNDLAEGGICQFEAETINSQLGCDKGGDRG